MLPVDKCFKSQEENRQILGLVTVICGKLSINAVEFMPHFETICLCRHKWETELFDICFLCLFEPIHNRN